MTDDSKKTPGLGISLVPVLFLIVVLGYSIFGLGLDLDNGGSHIPIILATAMASIVAIRLGYSWNEIQAGLIKGITLALQACLILMVIGCLIGTWIHSGIVPSMIYFGLKLISPSIFLVTACLICCVVSLATGSSWSTAGTVGVALIGIGSAMQIPLGMVGGAVISGAYFGDKMSPLSDTTNLAPATVGTDLFTHIRHMIYTVTPSLIIALIIYTILGFKYGSGSIDQQTVNTMLTTLQGNFTISVWLLMPVVLVIFMVVYKIPALPALFGGAAFGGLIAIAMQGASLSEVIQVSYLGFTANTGVETIDSLLSRGGLSSMLATVSLIFAALAFGGVMEASGMLGTIAASILSLAKSTGSLIAATVVTCIGMNIVAPDQYLSIVIPGRMYKKAYEEYNLHPKNLSRVLEDSGTLSSPLIPWNTCGAFMGTTLGVAAFDFNLGIMYSFAPFAFLNLINPIISVIYGYTGYSIHKIDPDKPEEGTVAEVV